MKKQIKTREFKESNYKSVFFNNKTIRMAIDTTKPITKLEYSEFYDISIGGTIGYCLGNCQECYLDASPKWNFCIGCC